MISRFLTRVRTCREVLFLAVLSYVPTLVFSAGTYNADTKLYLTTDVRRLVSQARYAWDPSQFGGYVPHQAVGYLWPVGPFYWLFDLLHLPPWVAQRSWVATLFFLASLGVYSMCRHFGYRALPAVVAAVAYQFTPYVLAYQSRTSAMLLPWVGLPWIILLIDRGLATRTWRHPALIALVVGSVGGINATSLIMVVAAPVLFLLDHTIRRRNELRTVARFVLRTGILCSLISVWWAVMVALQGQYGGDVLTYSETVEAVSSTSTATEVFRGLGYWLNYVVTPTFNGTTNALSYLHMGPLFFLSFLIPVAGIVGILFVPSPLRRVASWWLFIGVVLAVGVHPLGESSPVMKLLADRPTSSISMALRSSTRAIPVLLLAVVVGLASLTEPLLRFVHSKVPPTSKKIARPAAGVAMLVIIVSVVPSRFTTGVGDESLSHSAIPEYWRQAGTSISTRLAHGSRVLQLPGQEFGAYTWGYTVDPALPAVTNTPVITRDLLPLGDPQAMDMLNAIDDAARLGTLTKSAVEALSQMIGIGAVVVPRDLNTDRFGTYSPSQVQRELEGFERQDFGAADASVSVNYLPSAPLASLESGLTIIEGSGDGVVNAARTGLPVRFLRYANDLSDAELRQAVSAGARVVVTDSNRVQAQQWRGSIDTRGFSEDGVSEPIAVDTADRRLRVFTDSTLSSRTLVLQTGAAAATASSYGHPLGYWPESRAAYAIDGRVETAWTTGTFADPVGQVIQLRFSENNDELRLQQPEGRRWISRVDIRVDASEPWVSVRLDKSQRYTGQSIALARSTRQVDVRISTVEVNDDYRGPILDGVGFSEMLSTRARADERTVVPSRLISLLSSTVMPDFVFSRVRAPIAQWWRHDPELTFNRTFVAPTAATYSLQIRGRISERNDPAFSELFGMPTSVSNTEPSDLQHRGWRLTDGDPTTSWLQRVGDDSLPVIHLQSDNPSRTLHFDQCRTDTCNAVTRLEISDGQRTVLANVDSLGTVDTRVLEPGEWTITILSTTGRKYQEPRFALTIPRPIQIFEISGDGVRKASLLGEAKRGPEILLNRERVASTSDDLDIAPDGTFTISVDADIAKGINTIEASDDLWLIDDVHLAPRMTSVGSVDALPLVFSGSSTRRRIEIPPHDSAMWLVVREGYSPAWQASLEGKKLESHTRSNGGFNAWLVPASTSSKVVTLEFTPQSFAFAAQWISLLTALLCIGIVLRTRKSSNARAFLVPKLETSCVRSARWTAIAALPILTGVFVAVSYIPVALVFGFVFIHGRRLRVALASALLVVTYAVARTHVRVLLAHPLPLFNWPASVETFHRPLLFGVLAVATAVTLTDSQRAEN